MTRPEDFFLSSFCINRVKRRRCTVWLILFCSLISLTIYSVQLYAVTTEYYNPPAPPSKFNNYFLTADQAVEMGNLIHTPTCKIPNESAWDEAILPIIREEDIPPPNCKELHPRHWTYTQGSNLVINVTSMEESGYSMGSVTCCYFGITRISQSIDNYDGNADLKIRYSSSCTLLDQVSNKLTTPFVRVHCQGKCWSSSSDILYRRFYAVAILPSTPNVTAKLSYWKHEGVKRTPDVLVIGIDSMSRLSFTRTMPKPKTRKVLEGMGALEMFGYTKVGENILPNVMAALAGYSEEELHCIYYIVIYFYEVGMRKSRS